VLLLRNKDPEYNNPLASFATCICRQRSELRTCAKRVGGHAFIFPALLTCLHA